MKNKFFIAALALSFGLFSCEKDKLEQDESNITTEEQTHKVSDGIVVLGDKINDPYAIYNMKTAYSNLKSAGEDAPIEEILPNKKYLRFLPKDEIELAILKSDTAIVTFDFPLDYEIEVYGTYYHDPELPDSAITWQYCVVPIEYVEPNIQHELLYEVYIPSFDSLELDTTLKSAYISNEFYENLVIESFKLTGNIKDTESSLKSTQGIFKPKRWHPAGRITVVDSDFGSIPLEGAQVHARWSTHVESSITDNDGRFRMGGFIFEVNYSIKWERADFDIRSGNWGQAWYNGPKQKGDWNLPIGQGGLSWCYAHIHRGAFTYYYRNGNYGIQQPPRQGGILNQRLHIGAMDKDGRSHYYDFNKFFTTPQVKVYCKRGSSWRSSVDIFATTVHELAHASHWEMGYSTAQYLVDYIFRKALIPESWASCVEHVITSDVYPHRSWNNKQNETFDDFEGYTPLFIDLIDNLNQRQREQNANNPNFMDFPIDRVTGYTLSQLEDVLDATYFDLRIPGTWATEALFESFALSIYKNKLRNSYTNSTSGNINELFSNYY